MLRITREQTEEFRRQQITSFAASTEQQIAHHHPKEYEVLGRKQVREIAQDAVELCLERGVVAEQEVSVFVLALIQTRIEMGSPPDAELVLRMLFGDKARELPNCQ